jgi:hypothetical protein
MQRNNTLIKFSLIVINLLFAVLACADTNVVTRFSFPRWGTSVRGASAYNFKTDIEGGGTFYVNRFFVDAGLSRMWRFDRMLSVSAGFGQDDYRFGGLASEPWNNINTYRAGLFARWGVGEKWVLFGGPSVRSYGESEAAFGDTLTAAFFGGASYRFSDRLTLGPGLGVVGQLADDVRFFPVILVNWKITERLSLDTGGGLAATAGPGLSLNYAFTKHWKAGLTGRYENERFRLNPDRPVPNGVGEDRNIPLIGSFGYQFYPGGYLGVICGVHFGGKLQAEDEFGNIIYEKTYKTSASAGFNASFRF